MPERGKEKRIIERTTPKSTNAMGRRRLDNRDSKSTRKKKSEIKATN